MERIIFNENPINSKDQMGIKRAGSKSHIDWEQFTYIDFIPGTRKNRKTAYLITSFGRVFEVATRKEIKYTKVNKGRGCIYDRVSLYLENKGYELYSVNDLVASAFVYTPDRDLYERNIVYSIDGTRTNHEYINLKWVNGTEQYILQKLKTLPDDCDLDSFIRLLVKRNYYEDDIKAFFKSNPINRRVKVTDIRRIKKELIK